MRTLIAVALLLPILASAADFLPTLNALRSGVKIYGANLDINDESWYLGKIDCFVGKEGETVDTKFLVINRHNEKRWYDVADIASRVILTSTWVKSDDPALSNTRIKYCD